MAHVTTLASDAFEGRGPGTPGETRTVDYLVEQFRLAGLQPGNPDGTYIQRVPLVGYTTVPEIQIEAAGVKTSLTFLDDFVHDYPALRPIGVRQACGDRLCRVRRGGTRIRLERLRRHRREEQAGPRAERRAVQARRHRSENARPGILQGRHAHLLFNAGVQVRSRREERRRGDPRRLRPGYGQTPIRSSRRSRKWRASGWPPRGPAPP